MNVFFYPAGLWKMPVNLLTPLIVSGRVGPPPSQNRFTDPEVKRWPLQLFLPWGCATPLPVFFSHPPFSSSSSTIPSLRGKKAPCSDNRHFLPYVGLTSSSGSQQVTLVNFHSTAWWDFLPISPVGLDSKSRRPSRQGPSRPVCPQ